MNNRYSINLLLSSGLLFSAGIMLLANEQINQTTSSMWLLMRPRFF